MSDNDLISPNLDELIRRRDAMEAVETEENLIGAMDSLWDGSFKRTKRAAVRVIAGVPAVPQEMTAMEFVEAFQEMCYKKYIDGCSACPLWETKPTYDCMMRNTAPKIIVSIVEEWAREHPKEGADVETQPVKKWRWDEGYHYCPNCRNILELHEPTMQGHFAAPDPLPDKCPYCGQLLEGWE